MNHTNEGSGQEITSANSESEVLKSVGRGLVEISLQGNECCEVSNVLHVPGLSANLVSVASTVKSGKCVFLYRGGCKIFEEEGCVVTGEVIGSGSEAGGIYQLHTESKLHACVANTEKVEPELRDVTRDIWHQRLGHPNKQAMLLL